MSLADNRKFLSNFKTCSLSYSATTAQIRGRESADL
jgi:hypothetical protein